jgi:hypothetical protein
VSNTLVFRGLAVMLAVAVLSFAAAPVTGAMTMLLTPAGTKVGLAFLDPIDTGKAKNGDKVRFIVDHPVMVKGHVVIQKGATLEGTVNAIGHPFPQNSGFANIGSLTVTAVDAKSIVTLNDVHVSAPLFGGDIRVKPGTHTVTTTKKDAYVSVK